MLPDRHDRLMADVLARAGAIRARRRRLRALAVVGGVVVAALVPVALGASDDSTSTSVIAGEPNTTVAPSSTVTTEPTTTTTSVGGPSSSPTTGPITTTTAPEPSTTAPAEPPPTTTSTTQPPAPESPSPQLMVTGYEIAADRRSARIDYFGGVEGCYALDHVEVTRPSALVVHVAVFERFSLPPGVDACITLGVLKSTTITFGEPLPAGAVIVDRPR